jgi:hypothetical protein
MGQHAEGVPLAAGEDRLGVDEGSPCFGQLLTVAHHGRGAAAIRLFFPHQRQRLPTGGHVMRDQRRAQRLQRDTLGAVDDLQRQFLISEVGDERRELPAQRHGNFLLQPAWPLANAGVHSDDHLL